MPDNLVLNAGSGGATLATDDVGGVHYQRVKVTWGVDDTATAVTAAAPLPVVQTGTHTVTGAGGTFPVTDSAGSLTVDAPVGTPVFVQLSDGAAPITTLPVSLAAVPSHAVTNAGTFAVQAAQSGTWNIGSITTLPALVAGTANIGDVDVLTVPTDPFGANADAASATGSISAKLRFIAATGIPITSIAAGNNNIGDVDIASIAAGNNNIGDVDIASIAAGTNAIGNVGVIPRTTGGLSVATGSITATATSLKGSAGQVFGWYFYNPNASVAYVQFFNTASGSVTLGTTAPVYSLGIPASSGANVMHDIGIAHSTAIVIAVTTTRAGSTSPGSSVDYNVFYT